MADEMNVTSPAAAFTRQARMEAKVESAIRWALRAFLADVEAMARREGTFIGAGSVASSWMHHMGASVLSERLPEEVARYVAEVQYLADTPEEVYDTVMAVMTASNVEGWSTELTGDVLEYALRPDLEKVSLTAAATTSKRRQAMRDAFDSALGVRDGMSWYDVAKRDARTAVTGLDGLMATGDMKRQGLAQKMWVAHHDDRTRDTHRAADGQIVPVDGTFTVGGYAMSHPGDRSAPPGETINCRCITVGVDS